MYNILNKQNEEKKNGFTLIEVIVSVGLFTVVMTVALGALLMVIDANKKAKGIKLVVNNINLAMEGMTRDLRVGHTYCDDQSQSGSGSFCDSSGGTAQIFFTTDAGESGSSYRLYTGGGGKSIQRRIGSSGPYQDITGSDILVEEMQFYIQGTAIGPVDKVQPFVTIVVRGEIRVGDLVDEFHLQSTVSQRKLAP